MKGQIKFGTYTGTGAAINLELGFAPDYFKVVNDTDGTVIGEWFLGMAAGTAIDTQLAVAKQATNGFTAYAGSRGAASVGITIGTAYSTNAKVYRYIAMVSQ